MIRRQLTLALLVLALDVRAAVAGQSAPAPPLLSTAPTPTAGAVSEPSQMSGFPLQVGDLPPGVVSVRVIRETFQQNLQGQRVRLREEDSGRVREAVTNGEGRAQFDGLRTGQRIQVRAAVGGEQLDSQAFAIPTQGGVRMVLVAGVGAGVPVSEDWPSGQDPGPSPAAAFVSTRVPPQAQGRVVPLSPWRVAILVTIGVVFVAIGMNAGRQRSAPSQAAIPRDPKPDPVASASPARDPAGRTDPRAVLFKDLADLEKRHRAGAVALEEYRDRHQSLMNQIVMLDDSGLGQP